MKRFLGILCLFCFVVSLSACRAWGSALPLRSDMSLDGLNQVVLYNLRGPAGTEQEVNYAEMRGVNENSPVLQQKVIFGKMSGSKTQDVQVTLEDGKVYQALGMIKTKRFAGLTQFMTLESATYTGVDASGKIFAGAKIRLDFNRNFLQYSDVNQRDFQSLWYYDIPCQKINGKIELDLKNAKLRCVVLNEVWQARIAWGIFFFNWGHSVTAVGGTPSKLPGGWWLNWDIPNNTNDTMGAYDVINGMVKDLESSQQPWLEFSKGGSLDESGIYLIYSAGDADQYANFDRIFLNRQKEYVVFYRSNRDMAWDYIMVKPVYNYEWNDAGQNLAKLKSYSKDPFAGLLDERGLPKSNDDSVVAEMEKIGWINAPNASLEQIQFISSDNKILYCMTVRSYIGANDSLIMFGPVKPDLNTIRSKASQVLTQKLPKPILYDEKGNKMAEESQPYTDEEWASWQRESTIWNFMKSNQHAVGTDLMVQYRFTDNTTWSPITNSDGNVIGYNPVEWNLSSSYYFDGDVTKPWLISQLLGEVGVRTLGMSYCSGRYEGTGMLFALAQEMHRKEFFLGYQQESLWRFDARASQLPETLKEAWKALKDN